MYPRHPYLTVFKFDIYEQEYKMSVAKCVCGWMGQRKDLMRGYVPDAGCVTPVNMCPDCGREESFLKTINLNQ